MEITNSIFFQYMRYHVLWHDINSLKLAIERVSTSSVSQFSRVWLFVTPWTATLQASLSITNSQSLLKLMCIKSVMPFKHLILSRPLLLPSIFPSVRVFPNASVLPIRWPKYWSFSFSISSSSEYSGLISFRIDWLDLLLVQGTLKSLLQHHSSKASILQGSAFFMVQLSHPHMTTVKTIALIRWSTSSCMLSPCLFNFYAEYIMRKAGLEEAQAGINIAGKNINNLKYADDTTLMAEREELKSLLMKMKVESEKVGLNLNIQKTKIMASGPITSWEIDGETVETGWLCFSGLQNHCRWWLQQWN